jgi:phage shock protein A
MNLTIAHDTLESHKYLLHEVQNRAAIAYFAALNRNISLYEALQQHIKANEPGAESSSSMSLETGSMSSAQEEIVMNKAKEKLEKKKKKLEIPKG